MKENRFKNAYSKISTKQERALQNRTVMEEQYNFTISDSPVTIVNKDGITSYNILIERDSISENSFENLVVQVDSLNQTWAYIFEYNSPATVPGALYNMKIFPIEYNATEVNSKITSNCLTVCTIICYSCVGSGQYSVPHAPTSVCYSTGSNIVTSCSSTCTYDISGGGIPATIPGPDMGSGGGGNSGGGATPPPPKNDCSNCNPPVIVAPVEPTEAEKMADHCNKLKELSKNSSTKAALKTLENAVGQVGERGFKLVKSGQMFIPIMLPVTSSSNNNLRIPSGGTIFGAFHSHPNDGSIRQMFSANDILAFYNIVKNYNYQFTTDNPDSMQPMFVFTVATSNGTYALKIDGLEFLTNMSAIASVKKDKFDFISELEYLQSKDKNKVAGEQESELINFVSQKNLGLSLYKAKDTTFSDWEKLSVDPSNIKKTVPTPCN